MRDIAPVYSKRITLRLQESGDHRFISDLFFEPRVNKYLSDPAREFADETFINALLGMPDTEDGYYFVIELTETRTPVGACCVFPGEDGCFDIGYTLLPSEWKKGYATEAVTLLTGFIRGLGGRAVTCEIADENEASIALVTRLGFCPVRASEFKKYNMDVSYPSHIYRLEL